MPERRASERFHSFFSGQVIFNDGESVIDCIIRNISASGAAVEVEGPLGGIPGQVALFITGEDEPRESTLIWKSGNRIGLAFEPGVPKAYAKTPPHYDANELVSG